MRKKEPCPAEAKPNQIRHRKADLIKSKRFTGDRDLLDVLLEAGNEYSIEEVEGLLQSYKERKI